MFIFYSIVFEFMFLKYIIFILFIFVYLFINYIILTLEMLNINLI